MSNIINPERGIEAVNSVHNEPTEEFDKRATRTIMDILKASNNYKAVLTAILLTDKLMPSLLGSPGGVCAGL